MSRRGKSDTGAMLELWRPPNSAGDPIGCLATTYTFAPGLFDEQCLARFLEIESDPDREDLAFLLERESRLGSVYAGVLVDHTQAGVEHSLRWDVLPVRIPHGKQHAKLSLLVWSHAVRIIVTSANLSEPGYRTNREVTSSLELRPDSGNPEELAGALGFFRRLLKYVPGAEMNLPEIERAQTFLTTVERQAREWPAPRRGERVRSHLVFTLPGVPGQPPQSALDDAVAACRRRGGSPYEAWIASPFFDLDSETNRAAAALCKSMARGARRDLCFCLPAQREKEAKASVRLLAPESLHQTPKRYQGRVTVEVLPDIDEDKNPRIWHAKMLALHSDTYSALMIGSSNFTCAGLGVDKFRNAEANLLTIVDRVAYGRETSELESVWPEMEQVDSDNCEWLGAKPENQEEEQPVVPLPAGFLSATYRAGDDRRITIRLAPAALPNEWSIQTGGHRPAALLTAQEWATEGRKPIVELSWDPIEPPEKLIVTWEEHSAALPLNVEDSRALPPPARLDQMTADDMLLILAAADPSAAFRAWARREAASDSFDDDVDSAVPIDLDPLRRHDLQATFLHRVRRRARVLAQMRENLQRPVHSRHALEWRLRGLIGVEPLAERLAREVMVNSENGGGDESLLTLADFLIVLKEVEYRPLDGSISKPDYEKVFRPFLAALALGLNEKVRSRRDRISDELFDFWERVVEECRA